MVVQGLKHTSLKQGYAALKGRPSTVALTFLFSFSIP
jgi:hypothetical protein